MVKVEYQRIFSIGLIESNNKRVRNFRLQKKTCKTENFLCINTNYWFLVAGFLKSIGNNQLSKMKKCRWIWFWQPWTTSLLLMSKNFLVRNSAIWTGHINDSRTKFARFFSKHLTDLFPMTTVARYHDSTIPF